MSKFNQAAIAAASSIALFGGSLALIAPLPAKARQVISDRTVGKTLAEVQCGEKSMASGVSYLNHMGVPPSKIQNITAYPEVMAGYQAHMRWKTC